jgi:glyoxylase-like metal-dependent hydrolase (beta-lactamase superfamily II)
MVTRLAEGIWWVDIRGVNAYVVDDDGVLTLVDAGFPWSSGTIATALTHVGDAIGDVERILVTHYDLDHIGGLGALDALDATVYINTRDAPYLLRERKPSLWNRKSASQRALDWLRSSVTLPVERIEDGDTVGSFTAYYTGGHTVGHTVFASEFLSVAFVGDVVRESRGRLVPSPWLICQDYEQNLRAIPELADQLPSFEIAAPGHGIPFITGGSKRLQTCADELSGAGTVGR